MTWKKTLDENGSDVWTRGDGVVVKRNNKSVFVAFYADNSPVMHKGKPRNWHQNHRLAKYDIDSFIPEKEIEQ